MASTLYDCCSGDLHSSVTNIGQENDLSFKLLVLMFIFLLSFDSPNKQHRRFMDSYASYTWHFLSQLAILLAIQFVLWTSTSGQIQTFAQQTW
ncbi:hypothetical protein M3Y94_01066900 [Aphelenchoides besseyi]|nr:hypothetical protein M3Y94_01066900 [Aphelenchoides besseyi]